MTIKVEIISNEIIKPSSPTPIHLRHYQLSLLDQISPKVYNPWLLFYSFDDIIGHHDGKYKHVTDITSHLKSSLSQVLSLYYPLAGRVKDGLFVDCNDEGVPFLEARVKGKLSDAVDNPIVNELNNLLPFKLDEVTELALGVQLSVFECGGIAVGVCNSHQLSDALSNITFIRTWVAIARGESNVARPEFISATLFPPRPNLASVINTNIGITRTNNVTKRFVFDASSIEALRVKFDKFSNTGDDQDERRRPSRVEALSAFIGARLVAATTTSHNVESGQPKKLYSVLHAVNLRPRFDPPLQDRHFGNFYSTSMTVPSLNTGGGDEYCHGLVRQVREEIKKIDKGFVKRLQESSEHLDFLKGHIERAARGEVVTFAFTSLCRFPVYEADFGWGNPTWLRSAALTFHNVVAFMDTKTGGGIEAYLSLKYEDMAKLEVDKEFLSFVSPI